MTRSLEPRTCTHGPDSVHKVVLTPRRRIRATILECFRCRQPWPLGRANDSENVRWEVLAAELAGTSYEQQSLLSPLPPGEAAAFWSGYYDTDSTKAGIYLLAYAAGALARTLEPAKPGGRA
jgi:hypothetical protein